MRYRDQYDSIPVQIDRRENGERTVANTRDATLDLPDDPGVMSEVVMQWLFLEAPTPEKCAALPLDAECANTPDCFFAVGPATTLPDRQRPKYRRRVSIQHARWCWALSSRSL